MTEQELNQYENYLLESPDSVLSKTIKGTDSYYYFKYVSILSQQAVKLTEEQLNELERYSKFTTSKAAEIKLRHLFYRYDQLYSEGNEEGVRQVLEDIRSNYFGFSFNYSQPANVECL
jgi:uroporphyrinogen-III synthase